MHGVSTCGDDRRGCGGEASGEESKDGDGGDESGVGWFGGPPERERGARRGADDDADDGDDEGLGDDEAGDGAASGAEGAPAAEVLSSCGDRGVDDEGDEDESGGKHGGNEGAGEPAEFAGDGGTHVGEGLGGSSDTANGSSAPNTLGTASARAETSSGVSART